MTRTNVTDLRPKVDTTSIFYVKYLGLASAKDGKKYLNIILSDATGDLESRIWNNAEEIFAKPDVDGGLIGGASLDAKSFAAIANAI